MLAAEKGIGARVSDSIQGGHCEGFTLEEGGRKNARDRLQLIVVAVQ